MKRVWAFIVLCMCTFAVAAQTPVVPPPNVYTLRVDSQHGESFNVFVDGDLKNRMPQSRVIVNEVSDKSHEVVVVTKYPVEKCAVIRIAPHDRTVLIYVNYDARLEQLYLYTAAHNRVEEASEDATRQLFTALRKRNDDLSLADSLAQDAESAIPDEEILAQMLQQLKSQSFENNRLSLAKVLVSSTPVTSSQIARLAETLDFSNTRVEFLKYAYAYCVDPENYFRTVDILTFTADKKKVLDYVATQK